MSINFNDIHATTTHITLVRAYKRNKSKHVSQGTRYSSISIRSTGGKATFCFLLIFHFKFKTKVMSINFNDIHATTTHIT